MGLILANSPSQGTLTMRRHYCLTTSVSI